MSLFAGLDATALATLDQMFEWICLPSGETLCRQGDPTDAVFIVIDGSLETLVEGEGEERLITVLEEGDPIGEVGALTTEARSATVRAIRDSNLLRIRPEQFLKLLNTHPQIAVNFARLLAQRLRRLTLLPRLAAKVRAIAIISATASPVATGFIDDLVSALVRLNHPTRRIGSREVDAELGVGVADARPGTDAQWHLTNWLDAQQAANRLIIYECDDRPSVWTHRALRQSDLILMVARGDEAPAKGPIDETFSSNPALTRIRRELVLLHKSGSRPSNTDRWLNLRASARHHQIHMDDAADFARLARSITGTSVGVALSGGGARGFAHIGVLKALKEQGIAVDMIGGTSMGSVVAAQVALGWDVPTMIERNRKAFTECPVFRDLTFPYISLMKGKSTRNLLRDMFGDTLIEDLWLPYFCVSTNLSRARVVVHDRGPLWLWVRSSSSVPGIGPPIPWNGDLLVDGGLLNNLPVDILAARCAGTLIASDAGASIDLRTEVSTRAEMSGWAQIGRALNPWSKAANFPNMFEILLRCTAMSSDQSLEESKRRADLYLRPELGSVGSLEWAAIDRVVDIGYQHACQQLDSWQQRAKAEQIMARVQFR
jgi:lysophospholipid hydrolase